MAGERHGCGLLGRLRAYSTDKVAVSVLGEATSDHALVRPEFAKLVWTNSGLDNHP